MRKYVLILAVIAAASLPTLAMAEDAEHQNPPMAQLSDEEMDKVTAAGSPFTAEQVGLGQDTAKLRRPAWAGPHSPRAGKGLGRNTVRGPNKL
jgi:hypothetical protein